MSARAAAAAIPAPPAPRANPDLFGQAQGEGILAAAAHSGRLAHAWLITGPPGIGKATIAFRFARFLLAGGGGHAAPAGLSLADGRDDAPDAQAQSLHLAPDHPVFRRVASGGHADLLTVERGYDDRRDRLRREIVVDEIRAVASFLGQTPAEGGWRIVIVDSADALNRNAANALLKVLEEPPDRALLLLLSDAPGGLLPTIRSRCRRLALPPLATDVVDTLLGRYRPDLEPDARATVSALADGSIGRALTLTEAGVAQLQRDLKRLFAALPALDVAALHRLCDDSLKQTEDGFAVLADLLRWWLAGLTRCAAAGAGAASGATVSSLPGLEAVARAAPLDRWLEVWEKAQRVLAVVDSANLDRKQVLLSIFLDIAAATRR